MQTSTEIVVEPINSGRTGRPSEYSDAQIIEAGMRLLAEGRKHITGFALRKLVGGGDAARCKAVWDAHIASRSVVRVEPESELPAHIEERLDEGAAGYLAGLKRLVVELNHEAQRDAQNYIAGQRALIDEERGAMEQEKKDAQASVESAEKERDDAFEVIETLRADLEQSKERETALKEKLADALARAELAEKNEAAGLARETALQQQLVQAQHAEQAARQGEAEARGQATALQAQHGEDAQRIKQLEADLSAAREACQAAQGDLAAANASLAATSDKLTAAKDDAKQARAAAATAERQAGELAGELKEVRAELERLRGELAKAKPAAAAKKPGEPKA